MSKLIRQSVHPEFSAKQSNQSIKTATGVQKQISKIMRVGLKDKGEKKLKK